MDQAVVTGAAAILGSLVGGVTTIGAAWLAQRAQSEREAAQILLDKRERLYSGFIAECSKLAIDALDHSLDDPPKFFSVYALHNRIRLLASATVMDESDRVVTRIVQRYAARNLSKAEMRSIAISHPEDLLRPFSEACREELKVSCAGALQ